MAIACMFGEFVEVEDSMFYEEAHALQCSFFEILQSQSVMNSYENELWTSMSLKSGFYISVLNLYVFC